MRREVADLLEPLLDAARADGREHLLETEGYEIARHLGLATPEWRFVTGLEDARALDLDVFPGDRVVLKAISPGIQHKSDVGAIRVVEKTTRAITEAVGSLSDALEGMSVRGFAVCEFVSHDDSLGGQLLLGIRWTAEFGPVVTFGAGGVEAELLARNLQPGRDATILSPSLAAPEVIDTALAATAITPAATGRSRSSAPRMSPQDLNDVLGRFLAFADAAVPEFLAEFEVNPLVWTERGPMALDALARLASAPVLEAPPRPLDAIGALLKPRSIGIMGVSRRMNPGRMILRNILREGFDAENVYIVKPGCETLNGCRCVPDIASLPVTTDLFVICVDANTVPGVVVDLIAEDKARSAILITGGIGEREGTEHHVQRIEDALRSARAGSGNGLVINGGNCLGVRSLPGRYDTLFIPEEKLAYPSVPETPLAVISQSGAFGVARASSLDTLNPRYVITFGNQIDLTAADYLAYLARDEEVKVFACYVEGFKPLDGLRFLETAAQITASGRTVLLYRAGRTATGRQAAASHTASIAGDYAVTRALAEAAGVVLADSIEDYDDLVRMLCMLEGKTVGGMRLGTLSNAGFECVAMADNVGAFTLPAFAEETTARLATILEQQRLEAIVGVKNPLDLTPIANDAAYEEAARSLLDDAGIDVGVIGCVPLSGMLDTVALKDEDSVAMRLAKLHAECTKAWVAVVDGGRIYDPMAHLLTRQGVPTFRAADRALRLFSRYCRHRMRRA